MSFRLCISIRLTCGKDVNFLLEKLYNECIGVFMIEGM